MEADQLGEVRLSVGEVVDVVKGGGFVFEEEFGIGVGEDLVGCLTGEEGDGDGNETGIEGLEVVGIHFLEGMKSCKSKGEFAAHLHHATQEAKKVFAEVTRIDQFFDFLEFVNGNY